MPSKSHVLIHDISGMDVIVKRGDIEKVAVDLMGTTTVYLKRSMRRDPIKTAVTVEDFYKNNLN